MGSNTIIYITIDMINNLWYTVLQYLFENYNVLQAQVKY